MRLSNEMGNQMFMYAAGYSFSKKLKREFFFDNETAFKSKKNISKYGLSHFKLSGKIAPESLKFLNFSGYLKRKIKKKLDYCKIKKNFYIEEKNKDKITSYKPDFLNKTYGENLFLEGHFETEKYFIEFKDEILSQFAFTAESELTNNPFYSMLKSTNSISICIRQNRFSEKNRDLNSDDIKKSNIFTREQINYIKKSIDIIKSKVTNPKFFIWSNTYDNLDKFFPKADYTMIITDNYVSKEKRAYLDLFLMTQAKHYIVIPSSYNWWGSWLSKNKNKIVIRPSNLNFTNFKINNTDLWPVDWKSV